ncbi:TOBE domain-containing protein [Aquimarina sediminis]|uniref:TOBE domain-containing protein n=1 Tax=Aquimarina sediminis TaxID=2070536 RepID=UPI000CA077EC|nr:TOBE domain-containing protein [Aquimarina sediminis]
MNILKGKIKTIKSSGSLSLVTIDIQGIFFSTIILETPSTASYLIPENQIKVIFKETEVIIGKDIEHAISIQNKIAGKILEIKKGDLLSKLTIETRIGRLIAVITSDILYQLQLEINENIIAMVKTTEIMLSE